MFKFHMSKIIGSFMLFCLSFLLGYSGVITNGWAIILCILSVVFGLVLLDNGQDEIDEINGLKRQIEHLSNQEHCVWCIFWGLKAPDGMVYVTQLLLKNKVSWNDRGERVNYNALVPIPDNRPNSRKLSLIEKKAAVELGYAGAPSWSPVLGVNTQRREDVAVRIGSEIFSS